MGSMSDLHILAGEVQTELKSGADSLDEAVDAVARDTTYPKEEIQWAYEECFGKVVDIEDAGRYTNLLVNGITVASLDPDTGELCVYQPGEEEPVAVHDLDL